MQVDLTYQRKLEIDIDNPHTREPWIVASKIKSYRKAMQYLGHHNQQQLRISCHKLGVGAALNAGEYVDLSEDVLFFGLVKSHLAKLLQVQEEIWETLDKEAVLEQKDMIDFSWIKPESVNFIIK
jgi:hypothetical protein